MRLLLDADGCPVVEIAVKIAREKQVECLIFCDTSHSFEKEGAQTITVSKGADSVDFALVNHMMANDVVVTQDYGLAAMCLARRGKVINQNGLLYDEKNMDGLLMQRYMAKKIRMAGGKLRGSAKRTKDQNQAFAKALELILTQEVTD